MITPETEHIHGQISQLPDGYAIQTLPVDIKVTPHHDGAIELCKCHNVLKWLVAIAQLLYAIFTLYRSRGNQIDTYGYASFGLTVISYAIMSLINLIANVVTPEYPAIYMVRSEIMNEAEARGRITGGDPRGIFIGTVGIMDELKDDPLQFEDVYRIPNQLSVGVRFQDPGNLQQLPIEAEEEVRVPRLGRYIVKQRSVSNICYLISACLVGILAFAAPYAIIGGWTRFAAGESTQSQRSWLMAWLVCGQLFGMLMGYSLHDLEGGSALWLGVVIVWGFCGGIPAFAGFIVVGRMLAVFPSCVMGV